MLVSFPAAVSAEHAGADSNEHVYVVGFQDSVQEDVVKDAGGEIGSVWESINAMEAVLTEEEAEALAASAGIVYVEPDEMVGVSAEAADAENWGLEATNAPAAWEHGFTGADVDVAVIDTGISTSHPSLEVEDGYAAVDYTDSYDDDNGHGTHAAGIIGANQPQSGLMGVAPRADLYAVKVLDDSGNGSITQILDGLEWAMEQDVDVINMSFGTLTDSRPLEAMLDDAYRDGIIITAASGNRGEGDTSSGRVEYPARYGSVVAVSAVDQQKERAYFSASGKTVEIAAPGVDIVSTYKDNTYGPLSGTSMATPFVSGALAILKEAYPEHTPDELRSMLHQEAEDLGEPGRDSRFGYGLLQMPDVSDSEVVRDGTYPDDENSGGSEQPEEDDIDEHPIDDIPTNNVTFDLEASPSYNDDGSAAAALEWTAIDDADVSSYYVYRDGVQHAEVTEETAFIDEGLSSGTYEYEVSAVYADGSESNRSEAVSVTIEDNDSPPAENTAFQWPEVVEQAPSFADVNDNFWAVTPITELAARGIMTGSNDEFRPNDSVTRGQALAVIGRFLGWDSTPRNTDFPDVDASYFGSGYIAHAVNAGFISGFADGYFQPNRPITRGQMAAILGSVFDVNEASGTNRFTDVDETTTGYDTIGYLARHNIVQGYDNQTFRPNNSLSRAQFASVFYGFGEHLIHN
ncbi:subtilisin [Alteribacillus persepolensis]|uniref:Subtilisin n=1 Tax=Alteribacillus persepolensis TaxID=568899 RepID=A0A1G8H8W6_9BACI|nr:subtilisin [Alteribacillus persepolensis]